MISSQLTAKGRDMNDEGFSQSLPWWLPPAINTNPISTEKCLQPQHELNNIDTRIYHQINQNHIGFLLLLTFIKPHAEDRIRTSIKRRPTTPI